MAFTKVSRATFTGRLKLPVSIVKMLGWADDASLDVSVGDGDDAGWFALNPAPETEKHRAKFKVQKNGVGVYSSSAIVPAGTADKVKTYAPEARLDEESKTLFVKLAA
jgi:hypothetical protein